MSVIGSNILAGASGNQGYFLTNSLRFRSSASAYLNRTPASAGNRRTWTWSAWVKRGDLTNFNMLFSAFSSGTGDAIGFRSFGTALYPNSLYFYLNDLTDAGVYTNAVFRDPSAWYHIVLAVDTTQATSSNRIKLYINGTQQTFVSAAYPTQNYDCRINNNVAHQISAVNNASYLDGYLGEVNFIDGQALTPSSFGQTSAITGVWQPIKYTGTYGTNGFYLPFTDNSALTTSSNAGLGKDFSGNANYWTTNNISITSGETYDSMTDVPTLTSATAANYCTLNPLWTSGTATDPTLTGGNLNVASNGGATFRRWAGTVGIDSGKYYFEVTRTDAVGLGNYFAFGVTNANSALSTDSYSGNPTSSGATAVEWVLTDRATACNTSTYTDLSGTIGTIGQNDVVQICIDMGSKKIWFGKNNTFSGSPSAGTSEAFSNLASLIAPIVYVNGALSSVTASINFGQRPFAYTPPTGFVRLNTFNLPTPTIGATASSQANKYMNIALYTGTGSSQSITGLGFQPDWTWIKGRSGATDHGLYDAVRGVQNQLESNTTTAETAEATGLTAFGSDGFTVGALAQLNTSSATYVAWNWKANGAGSSNTAGSITSTVSANTSAGFSIVTYTGTGANATVGHGLGVAPSMIIIKKRNSTGPWEIYHSALGNGQVIYLNTTGASIAGSDWQNTNPTSSVWSMSVAPDINGSGSTYVAYCFAQIAGYSAFGSYTGNASTNGPFVYTGFRPRFILIKNSNVAGNNWWLLDTARSTYNVQDALLNADTSGAENNTTAVSIDFLSNGFKPRTTDGGMNGSGNTMIFMAFAESPFKFSNAR
jgi:hypothetical protein